MPSLPSEVEQALADVDGETAVVFGRPERVAEACSVLRRHAAGWLTRGARRRPRAAGARAAGALRSAGPAGRRAAVGAGRAKPPTRGPSRSGARGRDARVVSTALEMLADRVCAATAPYSISPASGRFAATRPGRGRTARRRQDARYDRSRAGASPGRARRRRRRARTLPADRAKSPLRRLAGRVLDLPGMPPAERVAGEVLGEERHACSVPTWPTREPATSTCSTSRDRTARRGRWLEALRAAEQQADPALLREVIADLGWRRVNLGLDVRRVVGVSVDGSMPFLLTPAEATIFEGCRGARRVFEQLLVFAHGGAARRGERTRRRARPDRPFRTSQPRARRSARRHARRQPTDASARAPDPRRAWTASWPTSWRSSASAPRRPRSPSRVYAGLKTRVLSELQQAADDAWLSPTLTRLVLMFEDPPSAGEVRTLHGLKRYLHQRGLKLGFGLLEDGTRHQPLGRHRDRRGPADQPRRAAHRVRRLRAGARPATARSRRPPYPVAIVAEAFAQQLLHGETSLPSVRVFCYGNEVHYFVAFRNHPVFVRTDFSPPLGGGMIDLQYYGVSKYDLASHPRISLDGIRSLFERLDFEIEIENTRIHARYDKERALTLADLCQRAEMLFRLSPYLMDVDWVIGQLDAGRGRQGPRGQGLGRAVRSLGRPAPRATAERRPARNRRRRGAGGRGERVATLAGNGTVPGSLHGPALGGVPRRPARELAKHGLDELALIEREHEAGQIPLLQRVLQPLRRAVARGELVESAAGLRPAPADMLRAAARGPRSSRRSSSPTTSASRAPRGWRSSLPRSSARCTSRRPARSTATTSSARGSSCATRRSASTCCATATASSAWPSTGPRARLSRRRSVAGRTLARHVSATTSPGSPRSCAAATSCRRGSTRRSSTPSTPPTSATCSPWPSPAPAAGRCAASTRSRGCVPLPAGRRSRRASGLEGRAPRAPGWGILVVPSLRPADTPVPVQRGRRALHRRQHPEPCRTAGRRVRPPGADRARPLGDGSPTDARVSSTGAPSTNAWSAGSAGSWSASCRQIREHDAVLAEGDLLALDADEGTVRILGQGPTAIALHDGLSPPRTVEPPPCRARPPTPRLLEERGRRLRALHQLERLFARLSDPVLVHHAVRELLLGTGTAEATSGRRDKARLIELLLSSPGCAETAREAVARVSRGPGRSASRPRSATRWRRIPVSNDPGEILGLRLTAARLHRLAADDPRPHARAPPELAEAAVRHVSDVEQMTSAAGCHSAPGCGRRCCKSVACSEPVGRVRHELAQLERLDECLGRIGGGPELAPVDVERELAAADRRAVERLASRFILSAADGGVELEPLVGWKTAFLAEIAQLGFSAHVPPWFVVTDAAFRMMLDVPAPAVDGHTRGRTDAKLRDAIAGVLHSTETTVAQKAERIQRLWLHCRSAAGPGGGRLDRVSPPRCRGSGRLRPACPPASPRSPGTRSSRSARRRTRRTPTPPRTRGVRHLPVRAGRALAGAAPQARLERPLDRAGDPQPLGAARRATAWRAAASSCSAWPGRAPRA